MLEMNTAIVSTSVVPNVKDYWSCLRSVSPATGSETKFVPGQAIAALDCLHRVPACARIRMLRNFSIEPLASWLKWAGYQRGVRIDVELADFGVLHQELLEPTSPLHSDKLDAVAIALWLEGIHGPQDEYGKRLGRGWELFHELALLAQERLCSTLILNTFVPTPNMASSSTLLREICCLNDRIREWISGQQNVVLVDAARLAEQIGWESASDERLWQLYRAPLATSMLQAWSAELGQVLAAKSGRVRKVLVLDCDEVIWGGIVGEDGPDGIRLDPASHPGSAYYQFQQQVLELERHGVLLALCSKNNEADVFTVLKEHPHCLLRPTQLAAWRVNWQDKVQNLCELAAELNLSLDQFVFIDDSPVECGYVRQALPQVDVLQVASDGSNLVQLLKNYNGFRLVRHTKTDQNRTAAYQAERQRLAIKSSAESLDEFLQSLALEVRISPASLQDLARIHQLVERTNQFNLTTRRHSAAQLSQMLQSPDVLLLAMTACDRFGDYGLTGVAIARRNPNGCTVVIDTFLMSCRVLGRRLEQALIWELIRRSGERWPDHPIRAEYRQTAKNEQVADFLGRSGFRRCGQTDDAIHYEFVPEGQFLAPRCVLIRTTEE